jgi:hypothetical protein
MTPDTTRREGVGRWAYFGCGVGGSALSGRAGEPGKP